MRKQFLPILAILILFSCKKENNDTSSDVNNPSSTVKVTEKSDINQAAVMPEAMEYYKNIATMAKWYAKHPEARTQSKLKSNSESPDSVNTILAKLQEITITDSANVQKSVFELDDTKIDTFLSAFTVIEANDLSQKLSLDTSNQAVLGISAINQAFKEAFSSNLKSSEDPYWKIRNILDIKEKQASQQPTHLKSENSDFWAAVVSNKILGCTGIWGASPPYLTPQTFVDRIRGSIAKGRLLIALPGGSNTVSPIILYVGQGWYDVGHVAVMIQNAGEIPKTINNNDDFVMTISTNSKDNLHKEPLKKDWSNEHGLSYVGQVYDVNWQWFYKNWHDFGFRQVATDVNNDAIYKQVTGLAIGTPYCNIWQVVFAKAAAPEHLICSSTAWWCAKQGTGVNIGDWWKPSIFPAGVYLSDRVRIIDNTLR